MVAAAGGGPGRFNVYWFAILIAVNLQTSFLTPPFGFALFYMKGVAPPEVHMGHIYRGIIPFVFLQLIGLALVMAFPGIAMWLPGQLLDQGTSGLNGVIQSRCALIAA